MFSNKIDSKADPLYWLKRYDEAIEMYNLCLESDPNMSLALKDMLLSKKTITVEKLRKHSIGLLFKKK